MEEILHHLGWLNPYKYWDKPSINWCRSSSIHRRKPLYDTKQGKELPFAARISMPPVTTLVVWICANGDSNVKLQGWCGHFLFAQPQWQFQDPKVKVLYHTGPYFVGIPLHRLIEGSLEVKLPTIWTVEKQR